jgi:O-antigen/teichoic acid export membrane protein
VVIIFVSVLRGAGDTRFVMLVSICMASLLAGGTAIGVLELGMNVYGAWWFITAWVWVLAAAYYLRYRTGRWRSMRVIEQVHHHAVQDSEAEALLHDRRQWDAEDERSNEAALYPL